MKQRSDTVAQSHTMVTARNEPTVAQLETKLTVNSMTDHWGYKCRSHKYVYSETDTDLKLNS